MEIQPEVYPISKPLSGPVSPRRDSDKSDCKYYSLRSDLNPENPPGLYSDPLTYYQ